MIIKQDAEPIDESLPVEPEVIEVKDTEFEDGWLTHKQVNAAIKKMTDWKNKKYCPGDSISRGRMVGVFMTALMEYRTGDEEKTSPADWNTFYEEKDAEERG
jgi:hypothetical protein